jgi:excisionase family DNA binding protein
MTPQTTKSTTEAPENWLTVAEFARRLSLSERTVLRMLADGKIPAVRVGPRLVRIPASALDAIVRPYL